MTTSSPGEPASNEPSRSFCPENSLVLVIRFISCFRASNSSCRVCLSELPIVPVTACEASSLERMRISATTVNPPSATLLIRESPSCRFLKPWRNARASDCKDSEIARLAPSSELFCTRSPEATFPMAFPRLTLFLSNRFWAICELRLLKILSGIPFPP